MAEEYAYTNWQSDDYHDGAAQGLEFDAIGHTEKTYLAGAYAVLEIINKTIQYNKGDERPWLLRGNHLYNELVKKIKELKGEQL